MDVSGEKEYILSKHLLADWLSLTEHIIIEGQSEALHSVWGGSNLSCSRKSAASFSIKMQIVK